MNNELRELLSKINDHIEDDDLLFDMTISYIVNNKDKWEKQSDSDLLLEKWRQYIKDVDKCEYAKVLSNLMNNQEFDISQYESEEKEIENLENVRHFIGNADISKKLKIVIDKKIDIISSRIPYNHPILKEMNVYSFIKDVMNDFSLKNIVGIQPMTGPIALAYALRMKSSTNEEVHLTINQKELKSITLEIKLDNMKSDILAHYNTVCMDSIFELTKGNSVEIKLDEKVTHSILDYSYKMSKNTTVVGSVITTSDNENNKYLPDSIEAVYMDDFKSELGSDIILCAKGERENTAGVIFCPYLLIRPSLGIGRQYSKPKVFTRFGICDSLPNTASYYQRLKFKK